MYDICIGIPSRNEEKNISYVISQIDYALSIHFSHLKSIIINVDGCSTDRTKESFLGTKTKTEKIYLNVKDKYSGKGTNVYQFLNFAKKNNCKAGMIVDADITNLPDYWVINLLEPIINSKYDLTIPYYIRNKYDATITNHVCFPLLWATLGQKIRQPIGGDFGFSRKYIDILTNDPLPSYAQRFGIDIFLTTQAILSGLSICEVPLGIKKHRERSYQCLETMFYNVTEALFSQLKIINNKHISFKIDRYIKYEYKNIYSTSDFRPSVSFIKETIHQYFIQYKKIYDNLLCDSDKEVNSYHSLVDNGIDSVKWLRVLAIYYKAFINEHVNNELLCKSLFPLFLLRLFCYLESVKNYCEESAEKEILSQGIMFYEKRNIFKI